MKNISIAQYHNFHWYYLIRNDTHGCTYFRISPRMFSSHDEWDFDESGTEKKRKKERKKDAFALNANLESPYLQVFLIARRLVWKKVPPQRFRNQPRYSQSVVLVCQSVCLATSLFPFAKNPPILFREAFKRFSPPRLLCARRDF